MKINQWLYADPNDGPSISLIPILAKQFPAAVVCTSFDQVCDSVVAEVKPKRKYTRKVKEEVPPEIQLVAKRKYTRKVSKIPDPIQI